MAAGEAFGIFPEGGRTKSLDAMNPFKSGVARLAMMTGAPIVPATIVVAADHAADDVEDVAGAQLAEVADVAVGRQARTPPRGQRRRAEAQRLEQSQGRVLEAIEPERDREVADVVDLPRGHPAAMRLRPLRLAHARDSTTVRYRIRAPGEPSA